MSFPFRPSTEQLVALANHVQDVSNRSPENCPFDRSELAILAYALGVATSVFMPREPSDEPLSLAQAQRKLEELERLARGWLEGRSDATLAEWQLLESGARLNAEDNARLKAENARLKADVALLSKSEQVPWLVKDFDVLYRTARQLVAPDGRPRGDASSHFRELEAQIERLRPAIEQIQHLKAALDGGAKGPERA